MEHPDDRQARLETTAAATGKRAKKFVQDNQRLVRQLFRTFDDEDAEFLLRNLREKFFISLDK